MRARLIVPFLLLIAGVAAGVLVTVPREPTWQAVWIGVASTLITAGLVDLFAQHDARQRENASISLAGERIEKVQRDLVSILGHMLGVGHGNTEILAKFSELQGQQVRFDLNEEANVYPAGLTKLSQVVAAREKIVANLDVAVALGISTWIAARVERIDRRIRDDGFFAGPISIAESAPVMTVTDVLLEARALYEASYSETRWFRAFRKRRARGSWLTAVRRRQPSESMTERLARWRKEGDIEG